ncbi:MAG: flagellar hook-associated protein FlgL [Shewanella sp.]|nr:flagellar hook-associated protein FlgL [Shewanella sp.]MCF1429772.1 flagellar hook-associated protein FlgL [Shewanella sp.]MCF1438377.1 flagellar hook-associated protein FlgL [Shewanella sp.]MCF1457035.1 flagellar hook-associated protein FlgL [Shewanella sp.]
MRISTGQMFNQNINSILKQQSGSAKVMEQLSSGKKVNTSADDPVAANGIDNLNQQNALLEQYLRNIDYANHRLALAETKLGAAEEMAMSLRDQILSGVNGSLSDLARQIIADEMRGTLEELLNIANSRDEAGNYLFAGFKIDTQPFEIDASGNYVYRGDQGVRDTAVANGVVVATNFPGDKAFIFSNPTGDYSASYLAGQTGEFKVESAKITHSASHIEQDYRFNFIDNGAGGVNLEVRDASNALVTTVNNFDAANPVSFNGLEVNLSGTPKAGDSVTLTPQAEVSLLDNFRDAIALLESEEINTPAGKSKLAQLLNNSNSGLNQISIVRGEAGNSLKSFDSYGARHEEEKLANASALSLLEDLDYASAVTEFEKQQLALNAVSSVFGKVSSLSLFDYL